MTRTRKPAERTAKPKGDAEDKQAEEGKAVKTKTGRLSGFNSHGKRFRHLTLPRHVHEAIVGRWPEGTQYDVSVAEDGTVTARPVARP